MRFEEGLLDQFISTQKTLTRDEMNNLVQEYKSRSNDLFQVGIKKLKNELKGDDREEIYANDEQRVLAERAEQVAHNRVQPNGAGTGGQKKKLSKVTLVVFILMVLGMIVTAMMHQIAACISVVLFGFSFFGFYFAYEQNGKGYTHYEGNSASSSKTAGYMMGIIGLAAAIPLLFTGMLGTEKALALMAVVLFAVVGVLMLIGYFKSLGLKSRKYTQEVSAECVGYVRNIELRTTQKDGMTNTFYFISTSPIFEYEYQGKSYKGVYDRRIDGADADVDVGPLTISIDPDNPEDIYRQSKKVKTQGLLIAVVCIVVAIAMAVVFFAGKKG